MERIKNSKEIGKCLDEKFVLTNMTVLLNCNRIKALFNEN